MQDILPYVDHETLVIFDIDNTVAEGSVIIATDQCFQHRVRKHMDAGAIDQQAAAEFLPIYWQLQMILPLKPVEECTPQLIRDLQQKGLKVIALTARSFPILERTIAQLYEINIDFSLSALTQEEFDIRLKDRLLYKNGIIFCGQNDKGEALRAIFEIINYYPKKIIFIDDKEKYLKCVQHVADELNIPFIGIRYSCCDEKVKNFDCQEADRQLREFCLAHNIAYHVEH
jgi:phosphoserine phosphatase